MSGLANVLSIAGSDPSGGAGIQADLKTFAALGCYGMAAITALTAQNTQGVSGIDIPSADFVRQQIDVVFTDIRVDAVKIGMLADAAIVVAVADCLRRHKPPFVVLDPVLVATSGDSLGAPGVVDALLRELLPLADLITPNGPEAARLTGSREPRSIEDCAELALLLRKGSARAVLVKGGHLAEPVSQDVLIDDHGTQIFTAPRVATRNTHGTGCTLSSAIAARVARGSGLAQAVAEAKDYLTQALRRSGDLSVGQGHGPVHHGWSHKT